MPLIQSRECTEDEVTALVRQYSEDEQFAYWGGDGVFCDRGFELTGHSWISPERGELVTLQMKRRVGALRGIDPVHVSVFVDPLGVRN